MSVIISLRTSAGRSFFKEYLLKLLSYPTLTEVVICSGYFQEGAWGYSVSAEDIIDTIKANPNFANLTITVIGGKFKSYGATGKTLWEKEFDKFLSTLRKEGIRHRAFIPSNKNWHAKAVIGIENGKPKIAIIGSSNLTRPAYSEPYSGFNYECDVTLLANDLALKTHFEEGDIIAQDPLSPILAVLDPESSQPDVDLRLKAITDEIIDLEDLNEYTDY